MTKTLVAAALIAFASSARAQFSVPIRYQPEPAFEQQLAALTQPMKARDAFAGLAECSVVDAKTLQPVSVAKAHEMLAPCVEGVARRYGAELAMDRISVGGDDSVSIQVEGLAIYVPETVAITSPLMKDLQHGLSRRQGRVLGQPVIIRRGPAPSAQKGQKQSEPAAQPSAAQAAVDACLQTLEARRIDTSEDFIRYYGRCIVEAKPLKVSEIHPAPGRALAVNLLSQADRGTVRALTGSVTVPAANGTVVVSVVAYPETVYLP